SLPGWCFLLLLNSVQMGSRATVMTSEIELLTGRSVSRSQPGRASSTAVLTTVRFYQASPPKGSKTGVCRVIFGAASCFVLSTVSIARTTPWNRSGAAFPRRGVRPVKAHRGYARVGVFGYDARHELRTHQSQLCCPRRRVAADGELAAFDSYGF